MNKAQRNVVNAHFNARINDSFDVDTILSMDGLIDTLNDGKTIKKLYMEIEATFCSIHSAVSAHVLSHLSQNYKKDIRKGFNKLFVLIDKFEKVTE